MGWVDGSVGGCGCMECPMQAQKCMHAHMHMHVKHDKHNKHGCLHGGGHLQLLYMYLLVLHMCICMCECA